MSGAFRLPDEKALQDLVARSHVRVVKGRHTQSEAQVRMARAAATKPAEPKKKPVKLPTAPKVSRIEAEMAIALQVSGLPEPERQYRCLPDRKFTSDFAWPAGPNRAHGVILEVDGGAHKTPQRFEKSFERSYALLMAGWIVVHVGATEVRNGKALEWIRNVLEKWK